MPFARRNASKPPLDEAALLEYAIKSLTAKMKSERDLRRNMALRAEPGEEGQRQITAIIGKLKELGYLSDERFAADYTRLRQENEKLGRRRVQQGLMVKGISAPLATRALDEAYDHVDEVALALKFVDRKRLQPPQSGDPQERQRQSARILRRLLAGGFSSGTAFKVLQRMSANGDELPDPAVLDEMDPAGSEP